MIKQQESGYILMEVLVALSVMSTGMISLFLIWGSLVAAGRCEAGIQQDLQRVTVSAQQLREAFSETAPQTREAAEQTVEQMFCSEERPPDCTVIEKPGYFELIIHGSRGQDYVVDIQKKP